MRDKIATTTRVSVFRRLVATYAAIGAVTVGGFLSPMTSVAVGQAASVPPNAICSIARVSTQPIVLADGRVVAVNAAGMAIRGGDVMIVGAPTYAWPRASAKRGDMAQPEPGIGVVRAADGRVRLVPSPIPALEIQYPRVASAGADGFHVVFFTGVQGTPTDALAFDTATVWYGLYDGQRWRSVERVAQVRSALLPTGIASNLVVARSGLSIAYSFDRSSALRSNARGNQGMVLLQRRAGRWAADTLPTWEGPRSIRLALDEKGDIVAAFAQSYFANHQIRGPALMVASHDGKWGDAKIALDPSPQYVQMPQVILGADLPGLVTWRVATRGVDMEQLEWGLLASTGFVSRRGHLAASRLGDQPAILPIADGRVAWLLRDVEAKDRLRVLVGSRESVNDLGTIQVPLDHPVLVAVALPDHDILVATLKLETTPSDEPAMTELTTITVSCSTGRE